MAYTFLDFYDNEVKLSFEREPFSKTPWHVWVLCRFEEQWLLTRHPRRGLEFPGGKVEKGEVPEAAAIREVWEETGARVHALFYIGQYEVRGRSDTVIKNIYYAEVAQLERKDNYMETKGPVLVNKLPAQLQKDHQYSFIMKDEVLSLSLERIKGVIPSL